MSTASCAFSRRATSIRISLQTGLEQRVQLPVAANFYVPEGKQPKGPKVRHNQWRYADYDGDGALDLIVGIEDWSYYGWDDAWNADGPVDQRAAARLRDPVSQHGDHGGAGVCRSCQSGSGGRADRRFWLSVAEFRGLRPRRRSRSAVRRIPGRLHLLRERRLAQRAAVCGRTATRAGRRLAARDGPRDDRARRLRLGPGRRFRS